MTRKADMGSKRLVSLAPDPWVQWITGQPDVVAHDIIDAEFQWIGRDSDVLMRASSPAYGEFLALTEMQLRYTPRMPLRLRAYAALAEEKYDLPVYPVLVNILPPPRSVTVATCYDSTFMGLHAHQDYRVINLWEVDAAMVLEHPLPSLLPFVPVLRGGGEEPIVRQALYQLRADDRLNELEPLLAFFASFVLELSVVQHIMRLEMIVLEESPWYQEIIRRGEVKGIAEGITLGREEGITLGREEGHEEALERERTILQRILSNRFGTLPLTVPDRLHTLDADQIVSLVDVALTADTLESFLHHLPEPNGA